MFDTDAVSHQNRPSARPHRRARDGGTAHTWYNVVTDAVFHAPMFALNADADMNACEPNHTRKERLADPVFVGVNLGNFVPDSCGGIENGY